MQKWISGIHALWKDTRGIYTATICLYMMIFVILLVVFVSAGQIYAAHAKLQTAADASAMGGAVKLAELVGTDAIDKDGKPTDVAKKKVKIATNEVFRQNIGGEVGELNTDATEDKPSLHKYRVGGSGLTDKTKAAYVEVEAQRIIKIFRGALPILPSVTITAKARAVVPGQGMQGVSGGSKVPLVVLAPNADSMTPDRTLTFSVRPADYNTTHAKDRFIWYNDETNYFNYEPFPSNTYPVGEMKAYAAPGVLAAKGVGTYNLDSLGKSHNNDSEPIYGLLPVYYHVGKMVQGNRLGSEDAFTNQNAYYGYNTNETYDNPKLFSQDGWREWINWLYGRDVTKLGDKSELEIEAIKEQDAPYAIGPDMVTGKADTNAKSSEGRLNDLISAKNSIIIRELLAKAFDDRLYRAEKGEYNLRKDGTMSYPDIIYMQIIYPRDPKTEWRFRTPGRPFAFKGINLYEPQDWMEKKFRRSSRGSDYTGDLSFDKSSSIIAFQIQSWDIGNYVINLDILGASAYGKGNIWEALPWAPSDSDGWTIRNPGQYTIPQGQTPKKGALKDEDPLEFSQKLVGGYVSPHAFPSEQGFGDANVQPPWFYPAAHLLGFELHGKVVAVASSYEELDRKVLEKIPPSSRPHTTSEGSSGGASFVHLGGYGNAEDGPSNADWQ